MPVLDPSSIWLLDGRITTLDGTTSITLEPEENLEDVSGTLVLTTDPIADGEGTRVRIRDVAAATVVHRVDLDMRLASIVITGDWALFLDAGGDHGIGRISLGTGVVDALSGPREGDTAWQRSSLRVSPSGRTVATMLWEVDAAGAPLTDTRVIEVLSASDGAPVRTLDLSRLNLATLTDTTVIATDGEITEAFDIASGTKLWRFESGGSLRGFISEDGSRYVRPFFRAESRAWEVLVLDAETGAELRRLPVADVEAVDLLTSTDRTLVMRQDFSSASFAWVDLTTGVVGRGSIAAPGASG